MTPMDHFALWRRTLADQSDDFDPQREILRQAFLKFREHTMQFVGEISGLLPDLTVHDITHLDALWRVADQIAGPDYPLNTAEAFVLGGTFLLHDAAHVLAAYDDGLAGIKRSVEWKDLIAHRLENKEPLSGSSEERAALFQVLRNLHGKQAHKLAKQSWKSPNTGDKIYLLDHFELREYYGDLIGEIAESHHWPAHQVAEKFKNRHVSAPGFLAPADWQVDVLKVAFLLRTADSAHIDGQRAPWFLFALRNPDGISQSHWMFQAKMGLAMRTDRGELRLSSGSPFNTNERQAWWLAYDVARMIDREVRDAQLLMRDTGRTPFATVSVEHISSPEIFATNVQTAGWEPVNVVPKIGNVPKLIANLGGSKLYGDRPEFALRELIQNSADAVRALRKLGGMGQKEGEIEISLERDGDLTWLHVTDTGIGMSRYVLTKVLLDFGNSLWDSESLRSELPGLASSGFKAVGCFGIGFFSVFMLGSKVVVITRRFSKVEHEDSDQWLLEFDNGLDGRPTLRRPALTETLPRPGTKVSVALDHGTLEKLQFSKIDRDLHRIAFFDYLSSSGIFTKDEISRKKSEGIIYSDRFQKLVTCLCPALDVNVYLRIGLEAPVHLINPEDWKTINPKDLVCRLYSDSGLSDKKTPKVLKDLRGQSGLLMGRISYAGSRNHAVVTHAGLRSGVVPKLIGILLGYNNSDLVREKSRPMASKKDWQQWVEAWIDSSQDHDVDMLIDLHPLCPEQDLSVYRIGDEQLDEVQLFEWIKRQFEVKVIDGIPDREDWDEISSDRFNANLKMKTDILILPKPDNELSKCLGFSEINYTKRLEVTLRKAWGEFEESWDDEGFIGEVDGVEITRDVTLYVRPETK